MARRAVAIAATAAVLAPTLMAPHEAHAQQAGTGCSGFSCLLKAIMPSDDASPASKAAVAHPVDRATGPAAPDERRPAAKPAAPIITIAVRSAEMARLKDLAAALPREHIRIIPAVDAGEPVKADFTVSKALGATAGDGKARLFTEQLHIVAGDKIRSVADLAGKVVAVAGTGEADRDAARRAFAALNVAVEDTPLDLANALDGLSTGDIDAVVVLAPQPVAQLEDIKAPGLHLVSWPDGGSVPDGASLTSIEGSRYPSLAKPGDAIRTLGVDAVLTMSAKGAKDPAARAFLGGLAQNATALSRHGFDRLRADVGQRRPNQVASAERR